MRIASSVVATLLMAGAVPSVAAAQVVALDFPGYRSSLDRKVPVATVSLVEDLLPLGGARVVDDSLGAPFVLGAATLDLSLPALARVVFTMTNRSDVPVPLKDVIVYERTMVAAQYLPGLDAGAPYMPLGTAGWGPGGSPLGEELQPGATLTVAVPISPLFCDKGACRADGFVVYIGKGLPLMGNPAGLSGRAWNGGNPLFTRAFLQLLSTTQQ